MNLADSEREKCLRYRTGIINSVVAMDSGRRIVTMLDTISSTRYSLDLILLYILKFLFNWFRDFCLLFDECMSRQKLLSFFFISKLTEFSFEKLKFMRFRVVIS